MSNQLSRARKFAQAASPILQGIVSGYANKPSLFVADSLFPVVDVEDIAFKIPVVGSDSMRIFPTERAAGAKSNIITPKATDFVDVLLEEHDLSYPSDYADEFGSRRWRSARQIGVQINWNAMMLKREYIAARLAQDVATYKPGYTLALSGTNKWSDENSDPVGDIQEAIATIDADNANRLILGARTFLALQRHKKIRELVSYSQTGQPNTGPVVTEEHLSKIFDIAVVRKARSRYVDAAGVKNYLWDDDIAIVAYVNPGSRSQANVFESSFGYTFMLQDYPVADTWDSEDKKVSYDRITAWMKHAVTDNGCGYLITGCV
jgi:hypothetical protein